MKYVQHVEIGFQFKNFRSALGMGRSDRADPPFNLRNITPDLGMGLYIMQSSPSLYVMDIAYVSAAYPCYNII